MRVLVVEDDLDAVASYASSLRIAEYRVDEAATLAEAFSALERCTYHVAVVDIGLVPGEGSPDRSGVSVLERLRELREGTQPLVLSAQEDHLLVRDLLEAYGVKHFMAKKEIGRNPDLLLDAVARAIKESPLEAPIRWEDAVKALAWGLSENEFVSQCLGKLRFRGGFENLRSTVLAVVSPLVPLLVERTASHGVEYDESLRAVRGRFWSKSQAIAAEILLLGEGNELERVTEQSGHSVLMDRTKAGLRACVLALSGVDVENFRDPRRG